jgi:hypothetical protein
LGARLAQRIARVLAERQRQNVIVVRLGLVEFAQCQALLGKSGAIGDVSVASS